MKGVILAAGMGTRLRPLTLCRAKPAIPFLNRPLIQYSRELLQKAGIREIIINTHHLPDSVQMAVSEERGIGKEQETPEITFSHEDEILGTAGAIGKVREALADDSFVVCNGKIYFEENLTQAIHFHLESQALITLVLVESSRRDNLNPVFLDRENRIVGFGTAGAEAGPHNKYVFTGVQIVDPRALDFFSDKPSDTVKDVYPHLIERGLRVRGFISDAYWCECSTPRHYLAKSMEVLKRRNCENMTVTKINGHCHSVVAGQSVEAERGALLERSVLWDHIRVGRNSNLHDVIVADGVELPPETCLRNAIVTPLPEHRGNTTTGARTKGDYLVHEL